MKKFTIILLIVPSLLILISGCSPKVYYTQNLKKQLKDNNIKAADLQFYNDRQLVLRRELSSGEVNVDAGTVKVENGRYINEIVIKKLTPGICVAETPQSLSITFEPGENKKLNFGVDGKSQSHQAKPYQIQADDWIKDFGKVNYDGQVYYITPGGSETRLLISKTKLEKTQVDKRYVKGVKVQ